MKINVLNQNDAHATLEVNLTSFELNEYFVRCTDCGSLLLKDAAIEIDGNYYCQNCTFECPYCHTVHPIYHAYYFQDSSEPFCRTCYEEDGYSCHECGNRYRYDDSLNWCGDYGYCDRCYDEQDSLIDDYHTFKDCGRRIL